MLRALVIPIVLVFAIPGLAQKKNGFRYGDKFQAEERLKNPVKVPSVVLWHVFRDRNYRNQSLKEFEKTVTGTFIDLDGDRTNDFLVQGDIGANITGFWLFRNIGGRQQLVLHTRALGIYLLETKHKGMRDIEAGAATAIILHSVIYGFHGTKYHPYKCWSEELGQDPAKRKKTYYPC